MENKIKGYYVFEDGYENYGIDGKVQLSKRFKELEDAKNYSKSWKNKNTYILALIED